MSGAPPGLLRPGGVRLLCLTASGGVPLFSRGSSRPLPFPVVGSLNGVHMFAAAHGAALSRCETLGGGRLAWRDFHGCVTLIAAGDADELALRRLLENAWNCMVMVLGLDALTGARSAERLKRELRSCYRLLDLLLERCGGRGAGGGIMGDLTHCADCAPPPRPSAPALQEALDAFAGALGCEFGGLLVGGRLALGTEKWWRLAPQELILLAALVDLPPGVTSSEYPVYLPQGSPNVAHRLLCFRLLPGAVVCALCGPKTSLFQAETSLIGRLWFPLGGALRTYAEQVERWVPPATLRRGVSAALLINRESHRSLAALGPASPEPRLWGLLRRFYAFAETRYFAPEEPPGPHEDFSAGFTHEPLHCYLVTDECKCYAVRTPQHELFMLADVSLPTFALRSVATRTLEDLTAAAGF